ncbi:claudin-34 isoform X2 [Talpa occidentalis]|uniref:claudin-34 isoform X2 n=1 Tax=Talpa occidentalis TaxID=50954 RepID=UPI001890923F|nr:claudin-34 isoform X2 [Talpa occidentalis]
MVLFINNANCQIAGFALLTIGWILCTTSMGLDEWRVWYMEKPLVAPSGVACVGLWKVCIQHHNRKFNRPTHCYYYSHRDAFLPLSIRVTQSLMLAACIMGLMGKALIIFALRNVYMGPPHKNAACHQFMASGILSMVASVCTSITVLWNYYSIMKEEGVAFPPLLHLPFKPDIQDIGSAIFVAALAAFLLLLSSLSFLSYKSPLVSQVHPQGSDI